MISIIDLAKKNRQENIEKVADLNWDFVIIGAGITGIQTFRILSSQNYKVLIIDSSDFASASSSNSGMLIWGGLLYFKSLDFKSVFNFSKSRDTLIKNDSTNIRPFPVFYLTEIRRITTEIALWLYWGFSLFRRKHPKHHSFSRENKFIKKQYKNSDAFEEAIINSSDSRYAIDILMHSVNQNQNASAFNYIKLINGDFKNNQWHLKLSDKINEKTLNITTTNLINCSGVWVDDVNSLLGINNSPYRHLWSKGVYLNLKRKKEHNSMLVFDDPQEDDVITYYPTREVSLFGPTEDNVDNDRSNAFLLTRNEIQRLIKKYESCTGEKLSRDDIVSFRVGVRPLCVPHNFSDNGYTLGISRNSKTHFIANKNFSAVYGGKFTGSYDLAKKNLKHFKIFSSSPETGIPSYWKINKNSSDTIDPKTAVLQEQCWTLKDYLRHRTFIHQAVANGGFGLNFEFKDKLNKLSESFLQEISLEDVSLNAYLIEQQKINNLFTEAFND